MVKVKTTPYVVIESVVEYFNITLDALIMGIEQSTLSTCKRDGNFYMFIHDGVFL